MKLPLVQFLCCACLSSAFSPSIKFATSHTTLTKQTVLPSPSKESTSLGAIPFSTVGGKQPVQNLVDATTNLFPVWVLASSLVGFCHPEMFSWFSPYVTQALMATMMGMGLTLTLSDFKKVLSQPKWVGIGFLAQYTIMPLSAAVFAKVFRLSPPLSAGLILVGCSPGGTASNLVTMIAKADVALSVLMTAASTVAAIVMTPFLSSKLVGSYVNVKAADLVTSTLNVVLAPVLLGTLLNTKFPKATAKAAKFTPLLSVLLVSLICGAVSAGNAGFGVGGLQAAGLLRLVGAVACLHTAGFGVGYFFAKKCGAAETQSKTISIETGMQNSALACVLARHFPNPLMTALPGAISATTHSVIGSALAAFWRASKTVNQTPSPSGKKYGLSSWRYNLSSNI